MRSWLQTQIPSKKEPNKNAITVVQILIPEIRNTGINLYFFEKEYAWKLQQGAGVSEIGWEVVLLDVFWCGPRMPSWSGVHFVYYCVTQFSSLQLGAVLCLHLLSLTAKIVLPVMFRLFPDASVLLGQLCIFKAQKPGLADFLQEGWASHTHSCGVWSWSASSLWTPSQNVGAGRLFCSPDPFVLCFLVL
jgi:hypothetical protein